MANDMRDIRDRLKNGHAAILKAAPTAPIQIRMSIQKQLLTIELARSVDVLQFSKADAGAFIKALVNHYNQMEAT